MKIEIELPVYKALTNLLLHEHDTHNAVIERLLQKDGTPKAAPQPEFPAENAEWLGHGVTLPVGTELRSNHKRVERIATVRKDGLELEGKLFPSLSAAAIHIVGHNINGWNFWKVRDPVTRAWRPMSSLR